MGQIACEDGLKNIGFSNCDKIPQQVRGMITTPRDFSIPIADAGVAVNWQNALLADKSTRIYLWPFAFSFENDNEDTVYEETTLGTRLVREGRYRWRLNFGENLEIHKRMFTHKNFKGRVFLIDDRNEIIGTLNGTEFQGFTLDLLNPEKLRFNDGSASTASPVRVSLQDNLELDENGCMIKASFVNTLVRLTDVNLTVDSAAANLIEVSVKSALDDVPVIGLALGDFVLLDGSGAAQTISGVTDNGDGSYALAGTGLVSGSLNLVSAANLSIPGFESSGAQTVTI